MIPPKAALFAGSFDPYTLGHHAIVRKAAALFDEVVVLIGVNVRKQRAFDADDMARAIEASARADGLSNVRAVVHPGLVADYCAAHGIRYYVRGLRGPGDYAYEEGMAKINARLCPELETLYLRAEDDALSSSMVRELLAFRRDVRPYLPAPVADLVEKSGG